jgi:hypothetical protein
LNCGAFSIAPPGAMMIIRAGGRHANRIGREVAIALADKYCGRFVYLKPDEQCVYVLHSAIAGAYKIGVTNNLNTRISGIARDLQLPDLVMVHKIYVTDAGYLESFLHTVFADKFVEVGTSKEFFNLDRDDLRWLASLSNVDSLAMSQDELLLTDESDLWKERGVLLAYIGDLRNLTTEQLRRMVEVIEDGE